MRATTREAPPTARKDPRKRPVDALQGMVTLTGRDPTLDYRWVPEIGFFDTVYYESLGWQKCLAQEGGVRAVRSGATKKDGYITQLGQILMCKPKAEVKEEYEYEQEDVTDTEKQIFDVSFGRKLLAKYKAGPAGYIDAENQSQRGVHG